MEHLPHRTSFLKLPNNLEYLPACLSYINAIAAMTGFTGKARNEIEVAVEEAVGNVINHAFTTDEDALFEIQCNVLPIGLELIVHDEGMPFDPSLIHEYTPDDLKEDASEQVKGLGQHLMKNFMDEIEYRNLGGRGKEVRMFKYLPFAPVSEENAGEGGTGEAAPASPAFAPPEGICFRAMRPEESIEVARCFFAAYGYSYIHEDVYYPERLAAKNQSGDLYSAVAIAPDGEVVSHAGMVFDKHLPGVAELAMGATKPCYQGHSVVGNLMGVMVKEAVNRNLNRLFANTVTVHPYSQKVMHRSGARESGFLLAHSLDSTSFKGISEHRSERSSVLIYSSPVKPPVLQTVYAPDLHRDQILTIYDNLKIPVEALPVPSGSELSGLSLVDHSLNTRRKSATLFFPRYGADLTDKLTEVLYQVKRARIEVVEAFLNLADPFTPLAFSLMHKQGFIFTGILPGISGGDHMILQYFNGFIVDYDSIATYSPVAQDLLSYIRSFDPMGMTW